MPSDLSPTTKRASDASLPGVFRLTGEDVKEFQQLVSEASGVWMSDEEVGRRANALVALTRVLLGPIAEDPTPR